MNAGPASFIEVKSRCDADAPGALRGAEKTPGRGDEWEGKEEKTGP